LFHIVHSNLFIALLLIIIVFEIALNNWKTRI
jgi:hypothetical protein